MENRWSDLDAEAAIERYTKQGVNLDVALRTYSSRLLGAEPKLVIHGGGNTSVKTTMRTRFGEEVEVICVKGSGWDMARIEPAGLPALRLAPLRKLTDLDAMTDEEMVDYQRANLIHPGAPNPSTETLLHAFLPHKYIDHTHANAVLALTDQPHGETMCRQVYGDAMALVPYVMPGFALAKKALEVFAKDPEVEGMILLKHGVFTFGETAHQAYKRMIENATLAEQRIAQAGRVSVAGVSLPAGVHLPKGSAGIGPSRFSRSDCRDRSRARPGRADCARTCRIAEWRGRVSPVVLEFRSGPEIEDFVNGQDLPRYSQQGTATPDHVIRIKPKPLIVPPPDADEIGAFAAGAKKAMAAYQSEYRAYFARNNARHGGKKTELDPAPRVILVPGLGLFGLGASKGKHASPPTLPKPTSR